MAVDAVFAFIMRGMQPGNNFLQRVWTRALFSTVLPWLVLVVGLPVSLILFSVFRDAADDRARLRFEREASEARHVIGARINSYADVLRGLAALFSGREPVTRVQFHHYVEALRLKDRYPGFDVVNYSVYVQDEDRDAFEQTVRRDTSLDPRGYPQFRIRPPGRRPEYFVLVYVEPMEGFEFAFGLDTGVNPAVKDGEALAAAVSLTRDSGELTASGLPIRIKSKGREYVGLAMRLAVYHSGMPTASVEDRRAAFFGSVGAGFNIENLMKGVLKGDARRYLHFRLYDAGFASPELHGSNGGKRLLLFDSTQVSDLQNSALYELNSPDFFYSVLPIEVGGRVWEIQFAAAKSDTVGEAERYLPAIILSAGLVTTVLLFGMLYSLASSRSRAVAIANDITRDLRASESSLAEAQRMAHLGSWTLEADGQTMRWSAETFRIFGLEPRAGVMGYRDFLERVHGDGRGALKHALHQALEEGAERELEHRVCREGGGICWVYSQIRPVPRADGTVVSGTIMDITERRIAKEKIIESQTLLNEAQKLSHLGCWQWSIADSEVVWSDELYRICGTAPARFRPTPDNHLRLVHAEDRPRVEETIRAAARSGEGFTFGHRVVRPDGEVRHLLSHGEVVGDAAGRPIKMLVASLDVTSQKEAEEALRFSATQLQALSRRLVDIQEFDRKQFSRELHDRIGQNLTALSINLDILRGELAKGADPALRVRLDDSAALLESTTGVIENVIAELRPPMLDDYGLLPALQWLGNEYSRRTGIDVQVHGDERMVRLAPATEIALFRITQEALNNVAKHAQAHNVFIRLEPLASGHVLVVGDDGSGFDSSTLSRHGRRPSLGMVTMRERTQAIGGSFEIESVPGQGTRVVVRLAA